MKTIPGTTCDISMIWEDTDADFYSVLWTLEYEASMTYVIMEYL